MKKYRAFNITLSLTLSFLFVLSGVFCFRTSYLRLYESLCDLWESTKFYFCKIFELDYQITSSVNEYSEVMKWDIFVFEDYELFKAKALSFFSLLFNSQNLKNYGVAVADKLTVILKVIAIALPCVLILIVLIMRMYRRNNTKHNKDTLPLKMFKFVTGISYVPIKRLILAYKEFLSENRYIWILWLLLWSVQLNLMTIAIAFIAYYLYFVMSFEFGTMYVQFCKLFIDLQVILKVFPWPILSLLGWYIFDRFRRNIALAVLRHYEARNCGFINELPIVSMSCGSMGKKKTTIITDMALSQEKMFRQKAFELIQANDMKFPFFPWISFEMQLRRCMEYGTVYNLATIKAWVRLKESRYEKHKDEQKQLYGYDLKRYGFIYDDGLKKSTLFDVLETYAQLYFIYVIESSLMVANYSIRTDNVLIDEGNYPVWSMDFFPETTVTEGRHAHILDFDVLRLGKKLIENNEQTGSFEFGVVVISEVGKERGNILDHKEIKKKDDDTNQKNDLFNSWLKMCRHSATVDNFPFIKVFTDEQRPESWGADARDLCDIVNIVSSGKQKLALPFYTIEEMITEIAFNKFIGLYYDFRHRRGDNTLLVHILKAVVSWLYKRNAKITNLYGYSVSYIEKERGTMDGKIEKKKYFVMNKKVYAKRFSTDCFSDYFNDMARKSKVGLNDYVEYETERATVKELKMQNSYFINALYKNASSN